MKILSHFGSGSEDRCISRKPGIYPTADGIRGLACLMVLIAHAVTMFYPKTAPYLAGSGKIGVWLFFVLSAFLLTEKILRTDFDRYGLCSYALGRFLRIFPLYFLAVILYFIFGTAGINTWADVGNALLLQNGFAHLWTVPVEFKFYFYLPFIAYGLSVAWRIGGVAVIFIIFLPFIILHQIIWPYSSTPINSIEVAYYLPTFVAGMILAFISLDKITISPTMEIFVIGLVVSVVALSTPGARYHLFGQALDYSLSSWFVQFGFMWAIFVAFMLNSRGLVAAFFASSLMRKVGAWSYPIYLFHWLVFMKLIDSYPENFYVMFLSVGVAICVGALVHYSLEGPIESFRKKVQGRIILGRSQASGVRTQDLN